MAFIGPIEDRLAIRELMDTYSDAVNRIDAEDWAATWAEDAVWSLPDYPEIGEIQGRAAIKTAWVEAMKGYPGIVFVTTPGAITIDGSRATGRSYTSEVYDHDGNTKRDRGRYEDAFVKIDGQWLVSRRSFRNTHRQG